MIESEFDTSLKRLNTAHRWRERLSTRQLTMFSAVAASLPVLAAMIIDPLRETVLGIVPMIFIVAGTLLAIANPLIVLIVSSALVSEAAVREDFDELRKMGTPSREIAAAYIEVIQFRVRDLWALSLGMAVACVLAISHRLIAGLVGGRLTQLITIETPFDAFGGALPLACVTVSAAVLVSGIRCLIAAQVGAYIGMRWKDNTSPILAPIIGGALGMVLLITFVLYRWPQTWIVVLAVALLGGLSFGVYISNFAARRLEAEIKKRLKESSGQYIPPPPF